MTIRFSAEMKIEIKNYNFQLFVYSKIEKKKSDTNVLVFIFSFMLYKKTKCEILIWLFFISGFVNLANGQWSLIPNSLSDSYCKIQESNLPQFILITDHYGLSLLTVWKVSKYGVFSGPYFPVFSSNTGKYGPGKTPYFDTFHTMAAALCDISLKQYVRSKK